MKTDFSKFEIAAIKRTAQNVNPMVTRRIKLEEKIREMEEECRKLREMQEQYESSIRNMTGGYSTEDLVEKIIEDTGKFDKNGNPVKVTKYVLRFPGTIIPPGGTISDNISTDIYEKTDTIDDIDFDLSTEEENDLFENIDTEFKY